MFRFEVFWNRFLNLKSKFLTFQIKKLIFIQKLFIFLAKAKASHVLFKYSKYMPRGVVSNSGYLILFLNIWNYIPRFLLLKYTIVVILIIFRDYYLYCTPYWLNALFYSFLHAHCLKIINSDKKFNVFSTKLLQNQWNSNLIFFQRALLKLCV